MWPSTLFRKCARIAWQIIGRSVSRVCAKASTVRNSPTRQHHSFCAKLIGGFRGSFRPLGHRCRGQALFVGAGAGVEILSPHTHNGQVLRAFGGAGFFCFVFSAALIVSTINTSALLLQGPQLLVEHLAARSMSAVPSGPLILARGADGGLRQSHFRPSLQHFAAHSRTSVY